MARQDPIWNEACEDLLADVFFGSAAARPRAVRMAFAGRAARRAAPLFLSGARRVSANTDFEGECGNAHS